MNNFEIKASPAARKIAQDLKINLAEIPGSGVDGRIIPEDVYKFYRISEDSSYETTPINDIISNVLGKSLPTTTISEEDVHDDIESTNDSHGFYSMGIVVDDSAILDTLEYIDSDDDIYFKFVLKAISHAIGQSALDANSLLIEFDEEEHVSAVDLTSQSIMQIKYDEPKDSLIIIKDMTGFDIDSYIPKAVDGKLILAITIMDDFLQISASTSSDVIEEMNLASLLSDIKMFILCPSCMLI